MKMKLRTLAAAGAAAAAIAAGAPANAAIIFNSLDLTTNAYAYVNACNHPSTQCNTDTQTPADTTSTQVFSTTTMTSSPATATATQSSDTGTATANEQVSAAFNDPASALFTFSGSTSAKIDGSNQQDHVTATAHNAGQTLTYGFLSTTNGILSIDYDLAESVTDTSNIHFKLVDTTTSTSLFDNYLTDNTSGTLGGINLLGGHTYTMSIFTAGPDDAVTRTYEANGFGETTGSHLETFDWAITSDSVPEPSMWAMMLTGFAGAGAMVRRRRRTAAV
jgi:hypothetical protein